ncbi:mechanosensitive ion channel [Methanosarcina sp. KYL-1]|uniref:mechanosensitive ion channel family protein n=1 Tax=Methanosarcina sp. KYL-1 TaxID=2602068 RepID=UPI00210103EA|nr:mechanosensitive ion channel domain-containing protein [Methanosarcina sp. KYL-1]MCQ1534373.1 mechanosensitive ion channel [Methanosarcina sp. KYL-1]
MADNVPRQEELSTLFGSIGIGTIVSMLLVLLFAFLLSRLLTLLLSKLSERTGWQRIKLKMLIPLLKFGIYGAAFYYIMANVLEISGQQLLILGGLFGAALGFGLKDLFSDFIGGIVITFEKPYQVGDKIRIGKYYGEVMDIGFRATKLVTPDDNLVSAPNGLIFTESVASANSGSSEMMVVIDLYIACDADASLAMKILREAVISSKYVYISEKRQVTLLQKAFPFYTRLRAKAYVNDLRYEFEFESDVHTRALEEFRKREIRVPELHYLEAFPEMKDFNFPELTSNKP